MQATFLQIDVAILLVASAFLLVDFRGEKQVRGTLEVSWEKEVRGAFGESMGKLGKR